MRADECRSASAVVSQTDPSQTPWAPSARAAAICCPLPMPPAGEDRQRVDGLDDLGGEHHGGDLAGVTARLVALGDDDVDAALLVFAGVPGAAYQGGDEHALLVGAGDDVGGRGAEGVGQQPDRVVEGDVELAAGDLFHPAGDPPSGRLALGQLGHPVLGEGLLHELPVRRGDHRFDVRLRDAFDLLRGHDDVEAVRLAVDMRLDPVEVAFEVVGRGVADRAEHAEAHAARLMAAATAGNGVKPKTACSTPS